MYPVEMTGIHLLPSGLYRRCRSFNGSTFRARLHSGLADYTAGWEFHPTLKISGAKIMIVCHFWYFIGYFQGCFPTCCPFKQFAGINFHTYTTSILEKETSSPIGSIEISSILEMNADESMNESETAPFSSKRLIFIGILRTWPFFVSEYK